MVGVDLQAELDRLAQLPALGGPTGPLVERPPALHIRRASKPPRRRLAFASYDRHLIHLTAYPGQRKADALETLLHEAVHLCSIELRFHDARFKRTLTQAAFEAYGVDLRSRVRERCYVLDRQIADAIDALSDASPTPPSPRCSA